MNTHHQSWARVNYFEVTSEVVDYLPSMLVSLLHGRSACSAKEAIWMKVTVNDDLSKKIKNILSYWIDVPEDV